MTNLLATASTVHAACGAERSETVSGSAGGTSAAITGPVEGSLVVAGGNTQDATVIERFIELGGKESPVLPDRNY